MYVRFVLSRVKGVFVFEGVWFLRRNENGAGSVLSLSRLYSNAGRRKRGDNGQNTRTSMGETTCSRKIKNRRTGKRRGHISQLWIKNRETIQLSKEGWKWRNVWIWLCGY